MAFFSDFKTQTFSFDDKEFNLEDLTRHVLNDPSRRFNAVYLEDYFINPGDRPDQIASTKYNDPNLWWVLFVVNNITLNDWPLDEFEFSEYVDRTYTEAEQNAETTDAYNGLVRIPHVVWPYTETDQGIYVHGANPMRDNPTSYSSHIHRTEARKAIRKDTLRNKLYRENEEKRQVKIVIPKLVRQFSEDFRLRITGDVTY